MVDSTLQIMQIMQIISGLALTLFMPGFAISLVLFSKDDIDLVGRIGLSCVLSIAIVLLTTLFIDIVLGVDTTPENIVMALLFVTTVAIIIWFIKSGNLIKLFKKIIRRKE